MRSRRALRLKTSSGGSVREVAGRWPVSNTVGPEGYLAMMGRFAEDFEDLRMEPEKASDAGEDRVAASFRAFATGKRSGAPVEMCMAYVFRIEARRIVRVDPFLDPSDALKSVGLREWAVSQRKWMSYARVTLAGPGRQSCFGISTQRTG